MQPASAATAPLRSAVLRTLPQLQQSVPPAAAQNKIPDWLLEAEKVSRPAASDKVDKEASAQADRSTDADKAEVKAVRYTWHIGADIHLYSSRENEEKLRNMADVNHRESSMARLADQLADLLWPSCQETVDAAMAESKEMARKMPIFVEEPAYEPPKVPHMLPFTSWFRNNEAMRQSFVCNKDTRCKPRLSWYNPNDGMVPSGWLTEGLLADLAYYKPFTGVRTAAQKMQIQPTPQAQSLLDASGVPLPAMSAVAVFGVVHFTLAPALKRGP
eukprot:TRINITY_DN830_c0_g1_i7.p2 TRINITY_DN830_c0_g1~~TRINITY_DN830_c0_g1_i7.p2  ORF type:complete len:273 (-),score=25.96 TRINITY_DN830_c0_g1_i7:381-1199(-)